MKTIFSLLFLLSAILLQAQPVPKFDLGINGGVIMPSTTGADRAAGGNIGILYSVDAYRQRFFTKTVASLFIQPDATTSKSSMSIFGVITIGAMLDTNWQMCFSAGQYSGKSTSNFTSSVNLTEINGTDTVNLKETHNGQIVSTHGGWVLELGARYHFGTNIHPFVGAGFRYNTQSITESNLTLNGITTSIFKLESIDEFGGYVSAGLKIPLSKLFCIDLQADALIRNVKTGALDKAGDYISAWAVEPAFRLGVSFDLNSVFDIGKHPSDYYDDDDDPNAKPKTKAKPKTPPKPAPTDK